MPQHPGKNKPVRRRQKKKRLTLVGISVAPQGAFRNPTAAITRGGVGALIAKTRKPA